ncbi:hypothetical protein N431DRAFT_522702 [Stipitochalara longipes BDJ]|nr:hypothetical protein N431DRAFT_522702 [Stipitochalara longipes BDJ]
MFPSSVATGLAPEALPIIMNANLAKGGYVLFGKGAIVQRPDSIQNLGSMSVLCGNKSKNSSFKLEIMLDQVQTGTLTKDEVTLSHCADLQGDESSSVLLLAQTNASSQSGKKNAIDAAILMHATETEKLEDLGTKIAEIPFTFEASKRAVSHEHVLEEWC